ncbi:hypothetical protein EDC04DRAFT_553128 [Pisolithus marmoratus]|nr:hypothetical protein EDC04DRAFT_553128 [Pisolithus marmoratus]
MRLSSSLGVLATTALVVAFVVPSVRSPHGSHVAGAPNGEPTDGSHGGVRPPVVGKQGPTPSVLGGKEGPSPPVQSLSAGQATPPRGGSATGFPYKSGEKAPKKGSKSYASSKGGSLSGGGGAVPPSKGPQDANKSGDHSVFPSNSTSSLSRQKPSGYPSNNGYKTYSSVASSSPLSEAAFPIQSPVSGNVQPTGTRSGFFSKTVFGASSATSSSSTFKVALPTQSPSSGNFQPTGSRTGYSSKSEYGAPSAVSPSGSVSPLLTEAAVPVQSPTIEPTGPQSGYPSKSDGYEGLLSASHSSLSASSTPSPSGFPKPTDLGSSKRSPSESGTAKPTAFASSPNEKDLAVLFRRNHGKERFGHLGPSPVKGGIGAGKGSSGKDGPALASKPTGKKSGGPLST